MNRISVLRFLFLTLAIGLSESSIDIGVTGMLTPLIDYLRAKAVS
jgi:hypothetical protein